MTSSGVSGIVSGLECLTGCPRGRLGLSAGRVTKSGLGQFPLGQWPAGRRVGHALIRVPFPPWSDCSAHCFRGRSDPSGPEPSTSTVNSLDRLAGGGHRKACLSPRTDFGHEARSGAASASSDVMGWLARHPCLRMHDVPNWGSWMKLVERCLADLGEECCTCRQRRHHPDQDTRS